MPRHFILKGLKWPVFSNGKTVSAKINVLEPCQARAGDTGHIMGDKLDFWPRAPGTLTAVVLASAGAAWGQLCALYLPCQRDEDLPPVHPDSWLCAAWGVVLLHDGVLKERGREERGKEAIQEGDG